MTPSGEKLPDAFDDASGRSGRNKETSTRKRLNDRGPIQPFGCVWGRLSLPYRGYLGRCSPPPGTIPQ